MKVSKPVQILFYLLPVVMFLQFAYGLVVREPFPSFMMPGFSRIENTGDTYTLHDQRIIFTCLTSGADTIDVKEFAAPFSKIAMSRVINQAFFKEGLQSSYNSKQKKYYKIIKQVLGEEFYENHVMSVRSPDLDAANEKAFVAWFHNNLQDHCLKNVDGAVIIQKISIERNFKTGEIVKETTTDEVVI